VLAAAGARVILPPRGLVRAADAPRGPGRAGAPQRPRHLEALAPLAERGVPLAGLEPSCILTLRDDYASLLPDDPRVEVVAGATRLWEEALLELPGRPRLRDDGGAQRILLHGHCHQKALVGTGPTEAALSLVAGAEVETLDSGCCGMAGLFGYEREHYEVRMGERRLFGAVRGAPDAIVVAGHLLPTADRGRHRAPRAALGGVPGGAAGLSPLRSCVTARGVSPRSQRIRAARPRLRPRAGRLIPRRDLPTGR
jgi:Fe-S oxidoreductase